MSISQRPSQLMELWKLLSGMNFPQIHFSLFFFLMQFKETLCHFKINNNFKRKKKAKRKAEIRAVFKLQANCLLYFALFISS